MPATTRGPYCGFTNPVSRSTPGPTGWNDAADPTRPIRIPASRHLPGAISLVESGRVVLAQRDGGATAKQSTATVDEPKATPGHPSIELPDSPLLPAFVDDDIKAVHVEQGDLSNCALPAILAAMANSESGRAQLRTLVQIDQGATVLSRWSRGMLKSVGLVTVTLSSGVQTISRLLYREDGRVLYARSSRAEGWVSFIEKAYAAKCGGYDKIAHLGVVLAMTDLNGGRRPIRSQLRTAEGGKLLLDPKAVEDLKRRLAQATRQPTVAVTPPGAAFNTPSGLLITDHAYAVLNLGAAGKHTTVKLLDCGTNVDQDLPFVTFLKEIGDVVTAPA